MSKIVVLTFLLAFALSAWAHPASEIYAKYSAETKTLTVSFDHVVKSASDHYIEGIQVRLNGVTIVSQVCSAQDTVNGGEFLYRIPNLKKGNTLEIILDCNKGGRKTTKMILN